MIVRILDEAEQDLIDGFRFYDVQDSGLGDYFLDSLFSDIDSLYLYAGVHSVHFGYNRLLAKRFPFAVYYKLEGRTVNVWAVLDCRQDPAKIVARLT
ncbi:MAG: type II toxin-antitoxin system RelE/ParE family toxin [Lentisphaerae bacterium]|nr:type II toxin-antitoxin system RelE/ParE family toxin [Lentisphaerota bacterium]